MFSLGNKEVKMGNVASELFDCGKVSTTFDETQLKGSMTIDALLQKPYDKHIGGFEIPLSLRDLFDADRVNAIVTWYLHWKLTEELDKQNTCTLLYLFGYKDGVKVIIAINLFKYLRHKTYDPDVIEKFIGKQ